jgi:hypothetical protein
LQEFASQNGPPISQGVRRPQLILACKASEISRAMGKYLLSGQLMLTLKQVEWFVLWWQEVFYLLIFSRQIISRSAPGSGAVSTGLFSGNTKTQKHTFPANKFLKSTQPHPQAQNAKT